MTGIQSANHPPVLLVSSQPIIHQYILLIVSSEANSRPVSGLLVEVLHAASCPCGRATCWCVVACCSARVAEHCAVGGKVSDQTCGCTLAVGGSLQHGAALLVVVGVGAVSAGHGRCRYSSGGWLPGLGAGPCPCAVPGRGPGAGGQCRDGVQQQAGRERC